MVRLSYVVLIIAMNALVCVVAEEEIPEIIIDVQDLIKNYEELEQFYKCFVGWGPCGILLENLKNSIDNAIQTNCKQCTEKQKESLKLLKDWYMKNEPEKWLYMITKSIERQKSTERLIKLLNQQLLAI